MKAYSIDLRQKIIAAYQRRLGSQRAIAEFFRVSVSFVEKLLRRHRTAADIAPKPRGGGRQARLDATARDRIAKWVQAQPDMTLEELCEQSAA